MSQSGRGDNKSGTQVPFAVNTSQDLAKRLTVPEERRSEAKDQESPQNGPASHVRPSHVTSYVLMHDSQASHTYPIGGELLGIYDSPNSIAKAK